MELPILQWIVSVVLSNTSNIPLFVTYEHTDIPPSPCMTRHDVAGWYIVTLWCTQYQSRKSISSLPTRIQILQPKMMPSNQKSPRKPVSNMQTLKTLVKTQIKNSNHSSTSMLRTHHQTLEIVCQVAAFFSEVSTKRHHLRNSPLWKSKERYSSCRYNERQLIYVTVVRRVRPQAERSCDCEGHRRWKRAGRTIFCN